MYRIDDEEEEKKKRREEADFIINSINSKEENNMSDFINSINYANSNNLNIETKNDYEKDFINRINEANNIIESINPSYKPAEKIPVEERNDYFGNTLKATVPEKEDTTLNNNINENIVTTQKNIPSKEEIKNQYNNIKNQTVNPNIKNQSMFSNMNVNLSNINQVQNYKDISRVDIKAQNEAKQTNKQIEQGGYNKLEATIRTILNNISGGIKQTVGGLANVITTATNLGVRGLEGTAKIFGYDDLGNKLNNTYNKINDFSKDISNKANYDQLVTNQLKNNTIKTSGNVTNIISNMIGSAAIGYAVGLPGTVTQGLSVGGRSAQEVLDENKDNIGKATLTGLAKGYTSYLTEKLFDANILTGGAGKTSIQKGINRLISEKINSKLGKEAANRFVGIIGENAEELIEDNVDNLIDKLINNKETPDFLSKDWWENTSETVKMTTLSTFIMQLLGLGGASFQEIEGDLNAEKWINEAKKIIEQDNMAIKFDTTQVKDIDEVKSFYVTKFTPDGNIDGIYETRGEEILNPKHALNIVPVVIKDNQTNSYNVIDGNTGVVLDNTQYESTLEAKMGFNDKASKLTDLQIKSINQKIDEANYMITDKIMQAIKIVDTQKNNFVQTDIENDSNSNSNNNIIENNTTQNVDNIQKNDTKIQVTDTNTSNIITQNEKGLKMENRTIENVSDKKVKSYQTDFPDIAPEIQEMANNFQEDLANSIPGERYKIGDKWTGQKRSTTNELAQIKDETNASWERIGKALEDIANGKGDYSLAKKIELVLDEALTNGYKNIYGKTIMPNETYLTKKGQIEGKDYTKIESQYAPTEYMAKEDYRIFGMKKPNKKLDMKSNDVKSMKKKTTTTKNNIQDDLESFSKQVDSVLDGTFPKNSMLTLLKETPKPLQDIGLLNLPITMTQRHLNNIINESGTDTNANYHGISVETIKQLPEAINTPLDILQSNTRSDSIVLTTYLADKNDNTIIASIKINGKGTINDIRIDTNVMTSAYGKDNYEKFIERNIKNGNLLYDIDRGVIKKVDSVRLQLPKTTDNQVTGARFQLPGSNNSTTNTNGSISNNIIPLTNKTVKNDKNVTTKQSMNNNKNNTSKTINSLNDIKDNRSSREENTNRSVQENVRTERVRNKTNRKILSDKDTNPYDERVQAKNRAFIEEYQKNLYKEDILDDIDLEAGKTNAQDSSRFIEQEIQKIEKNGLWDNSIPVTRLTDIRKTIEDYLGLGLKKGHFRQHAYGIYKPDRDVIRVKEYKDIDNILHETGHAMDLGNRLKIDKEKIADELLSAIDKHGGYERENRQVRLEEGFAEVIREYGIVPEQAKADYPQTVAVLEGLRKENAEFNNFITKVQEQIYNYIHQNPRNRGLSNLSIGEQTDKPKWTKQKIKQSVMMEIWDKDWALKSAVNEFEKIGNKKAKASENAYYLTRLVSGIGGKVTSMLADGYIDENGDKIMPGLSKLGEILENNPERFNDLRAYLVAKRDLEYKAKSLKTGIRTMDSKAIIEKFANDTQIQEAAKLVYDTLDGVLEYAVSNGLITKRMKDRIKESNMFYVPMQRVIERSGNTVGKRGAVVDIIKKRTGSELDVKDVLENIISNSSNIIQQVENNKVLKALYNQGEEIGLTGTIYDVIPAPVVKIGTQQLSIWENELKKQGVNTKDLDLDKTIDIFVPNNKVDSKNLITSFINEDGKRTYLQFNDDILFNSIMNMDKPFMSKVLQINKIFNLPLRYGATIANIGFAIPNMISDTTQASILSTAGFIPIVDNIYGVLDILAATIPNANKFLKNVAPEYANRNEMLYTLYKQSGATSSTRLSPYRESTQVLMKDVYGTKNSDILGVKEKYKPLKGLLNILTYIPEISEQSTRFEVFKKNYNYYKKKGTSETDSRILAALESRDATQDFNRTGNLTREINQLIPFSAARVGSAYTFFEKVKANSKQVAFRLAILQVIDMFIKAMGYDDEEIEELNQRKKDDNFVLKIGNEIVTIKKPQGIMRSILNLTEYIQDLFTGHIENGKEGKRLTEWLWNTLNDNLPADKPGGYVPNMLAPIVENYFNKDFYYNTDIVKNYDLNLPDSEQYYEYNSQLAILLGKIFNYSPAKIDNIISGYFGGLGTQVTNVIDKISGKLGLSVEEPEMGAEDSAVARRFIVNINNYSASVDEMYNLKTELTKKKNGGTITNEEEKQLEKIESGISNVSKINKQIKEIKKDLTMSGKEKADKIKILQQQKTDMARQSLGKEPLYNENIEKNDKIQFYITTNSLKKNKYVLDMTPEMKKEYEKVAYDYYKKYESKGLYSSEYMEKIKTKSKDYAKNYMMNKYKQNLKKEE